MTFGRIIVSALLLTCAIASAAEPIDVTFMMCFNPNHPEEPSTKRMLDFSMKNKSIRPLQWGGLTLPGGGGRATFMLALAGGSAPDVYRAWFHVLRHDIDNGFCYPLNEWVGDDLDGDGMISDGEAKWSGWKNVPPLWRRVAVKDGKVYGVPTPGIAYYGLIYRKDIVKSAGLDPTLQPRTWSEFEDWCDRLTNRDKLIPGAVVQRGQRALGIENRPWGFLPWVQSAGGDVVRERSDGTWEADFDSPEVIKAAEYLKKLISKGYVRGMPQLSTSNEAAQMFAMGEVVCMFGGEDVVNYLTAQLEFPPELIGLMPFPAADDGGQRVLQCHKHFFAMTEGVGRRSKEERDAVWACVNELASPELFDEEIRANVREGRARWCRPSDLERLGLGSYADEIPPEIRKMYDDLDCGSVRAVTEPWIGFWQAASDLISRKLLGLLLSDAYAQLDCREALVEINREANRGLMFDADRDRIDGARPYARVVIGVVLITVLVCVFLVYRHRPSGASRPAAASRAMRTRGVIVPWLFLLPAVCSIALWSYYPLLKGALMAFQDYHIVGEADWTGLDNFIRVALDPTFWQSWLRTLEYVVLTLLFGFVSPIVLAVLLTEIPRGKIFFRTLYFLPHLTSALVITLLWKLMFDPTENGMLNQMLAFFGMAKHSWLQDPNLAMVCCILPGVWASAGMSSLIYIAALGSMPQDYYEAAAIDGAGILSRFRHVTFPQLAPLLVINFVGAFIAAFQGMGSIFLLTFGGPGDATNVLSLAIWKEAYNNLRFSTATTMAWFLGTALVAFTYLQIRFLRKVEFKRVGRV